MRYILAFLVCLASPLWAADEARLDELFSSLAEADETSWEQIEAKIWREWSDSGSPAMDLLLERGREAMTEEDNREAIEHLTALVENAPEFAEGWNARATAYYSAGLVGPAMADIARTLELEPRHFGALSGLGLILEETGHDARALEAYRAALAIHPHKPNLKRAVERLEFALEGKAI
ncbi:tetratricopeptide repeat protein [Maritimibacter sp. DP4N28-5]|uniref:Tetratricopeptide repeat protein n=2 Tax=Maritimibacter dapengensis TaxID=2836868 RepID=A0ABS6T1S9_9RHOB|nr:tetratricopeptide repeat protein [Maritimibacter dapengensis]MBV7378332.1 tetratricopeptide repeat protein [Maritimibacter dapengensis]